MPGSGVKVRCSLRWLLLSVFALAGLGCGNKTAHRANFQFELLDLPTDIFSLQRYPFRLRLHRDQKHLAGIPVSMAVASGSTATGAVEFATDATDSAGEILGTLITGSKPGTLELEVHLGSDQADTEIAVLAGEPIDLDLGVIYSGDAEIGRVEIMLTDLSQSCAAIDQNWIMPTATLEKVITKSVAQRAQFKGVPGGLMHAVAVARDKDNVIVAYGCEAEVDFLNPVHRTMDIGLRAAQPAVTGHYRFRSNFDLLEMMDPDMLQIYGPVKMFLDDPNGLIAFLLLDSIVDFDEACLLEHHYDVDECLSVGERAGLDLLREALNGVVFADQAPFTELVQVLGATIHYVEQFRLDYDLEFTPKDTGAGAYQVMFTPVEIELNPDTGAEVLNFANLGVVVQQSEISAQVQDPWRMSMARHKIELPIGAVADFVLNAHTVSTITDGKYSNAFELVDGVFECTAVSNWFFGVLDSLGLIDDENEVMFTGLTTEKLAKRCQKAKNKELSKWTGGVGGRQVSIVELEGEFDLQPDTSNQASISQGTWSAWVGGSDTAQFQTPAQFRQKLP